MKEEIIIRKRKIRKFCLDFLWVLVFKVFVFKVFIYYLVFIFFEVLYILFNKGYINW